MTGSGGDHVRARRARPTRNQIRKAARIARAWWLDPRPSPPITSEIGQAIGILFEYRASFQKPLDKVTIQMRRFVGYEVGAVIVAQRLKRMPTIMGKLAREPAMDITRMQDIGGCRAVLPDAAAVDAVLGRIGRHWRVHKVYDYISTPKPSGYRAVHVAVIRDDRLIEIQLRTPAHQAWAEAVERTGARLRVSVKDGVGPKPLLRYLELLARVMALEEGGEPVDDLAVLELQGLEEQVRSILRRTG